jgi:hypothetical protein
MNPIGGEPLPIKKTLNWSKIKKMPDPASDVSKKPKESSAVGELYGLDIDLLKELDLLDDDMLRKDP